MGWDDSDDDDWEKDDLKLDLGDAKPKQEEWSDEEGHDAHLKEDEPKVQAPKPQAPKELTGLALKIAEREKKEQEEAERKAAIRAGLGHEALDVSDVDAATAEKIRRKHMEEASDLDAAIDAFGVTDAKKPAAAPAPASSKAAAPKPAAPAAPAVSKEDAARVAAREAAALGGVSMEEFEAKSDAEFEKLAKLINAKLAPSEGKKGHMVCLKALLRLATTNMDTEQCKELASFVSVLSNDKIKAEREKDKKKTTAKKKGKINIVSNKGSDFDDIGLDNSGGGRGWSGGGGGRDDDYDFM
jgi:translation initiation factor 3 subunit J